MHAAGLVYRHAPGAELRTNRKRPGAAKSFSEPLTQLGKVRITVLQYVLCLCTEITES